MVMLFDEPPRLPKHLWPRACLVDGVVQSIDHVGSAQCLVVLGEAGAGKSTALGVLHEATQRLSRPTLWANLGRLGTIEEVRRNVFEPWLPADKIADLTGVDLFLDGLDEALDQSKRIGSQLVAELRKVVADPRSRLRLRLSCRSSLWTPGLRDDLERLWPDGVVVASLEPLEIDDLWGVLDDGFVRALQGAGLGPWSRSPLILNMLHDIWSKDGRIPANRVDLYDRGTLRLFEEHNG